MESTVKKVNQACEVSGTLEHRGTGGLATGKRLLVAFSLVPTHLSPSAILILLYDYNSKDS